jgi:hypothetical protein
LGIISISGSTTQSSVSTLGVAVGSAPVNGTVYTHYDVGGENYNCSFPAQATGTVVSVAISQNTSGNVSVDDAADATYYDAVDTYSLGKITTPSGSDAGCGIGYETVGTVSPNTYTGLVIIHRIVVSSAEYKGSTYTQEAAPPNSDDTSAPAFQDQNPQSGGSNGKVCDLDAPGYTPPDSNTYRLRV